MRNTGLDEAQAGVKFAVRKINNIIYADDTTLMVESKEELKNLLMKGEKKKRGKKRKRPLGERGEWKTWLKSQHSKN